MQQPAAKGERYATPFLLSSCGKKKRCRPPKKKGRFVPGLPRQPSAVLHGSDAVFPRRFDTASHGRCRSLGCFRSVAGLNCSTLHFYVTAKPFDLKSTERRTRQLQDQGRGSRSDRSWDVNTTWKTAYINSKTRQITKNVGRIPKGFQNHWFWRLFCDFFGGEKVTRARGRGTLPSAPGQAQQKPPPAPWQGAKPPPLIL